MLKFLSIIVKAFTFGNESLEERVEFNPKTNTWEIQGGPHPGIDFEVNFDTGFLPKKDPLKQLPEPYRDLDNLLVRLPYTVNGDKKGVLGHEGKIEREVATLRNHVEDVRALTEKDLSKMTPEELHEHARLCQALFRDYTVLESTYLLEPCRHHFERERAKLAPGEKFKPGQDIHGKGRHVLPAAISEPLILIAKYLKNRTFMEYNQCYGPYNYQRVKPGGGFEFDNLRLIRRMEGKENENGFVMNHIYINGLGGENVKGVKAILDAAEENDETKLGESLDEYRKTFEKINGRRAEMYGQCAHDTYDETRIWIHGIKGNTVDPSKPDESAIFPEKGVFFECSWGEEEYEGKKGFWDNELRGESGANDSNIPCADTILDVTSHYPNNGLTKALSDFRTYRPVGHQAFFNWVKEHKKSSDLVKQLTDKPKLRLKWLGDLEQDKNFRKGHWNFTKMYIIQHSPHTKATGGTSIIEWLPNQLGAVLQMMMDLIALFETRNEMDQLSAAEKKTLADLKKRCEDDIKYFEKEVNELREARTKKESLAAGVKYSADNDSKNPDTPLDA